MISLLIDRVDEPRQSEQFCSHGTRKNTPRPKNNEILVALNLGTSW